MNKLISLVPLIGISLISTGCVGTFRARGAAWVEPPPPVVVEPPPPAVVVPPPPPAVVVEPGPINVEVSETISVVVDDFRRVWDWSLRQFIKVKVGSHAEVSTQTRWVTATWNASWGCYVWVGLDGQLHAYRR